MADKSHVFISGKEATRIRTVACDVSLAVHFELLDIDGECFATACVPLENLASFSTRLHDLIDDLAKRQHSAPARSQ